MTPQTAKLVRLIGQQVREEWPHTQLKQRLLHSLTSLPINGKIALNELHIKVNDKELIILNIDGDLGVYYTDKNDTREPIRISLLARRTVIVTEVYSVDVPCFETTTEEELIALSDEYDKEYITTRYKEDD